MIEAKSASRSGKTYGMNKGMEVTAKEKKAKPKLKLAPLEGSVSTPPPASRHLRQTLSVDSDDQLVVIRVGVGVLMLTKVCLDSEEAPTAHEDGMMLHHGQMLLQRARVVKPV